MVGLGSTSSDDVVVQPARQRQIREAVAMHVAHLPAPIAVLDAAETVRSGVDSRPGTDRVPDQLTGPLYPHVLRLRCCLARCPHLAHLASSPGSRLNPVQKVPVRVSLK